MHSICKSLLLVALLAWATFAAAQIPEQSKWFFGYNAALDFSTGSPLPLAGSAMQTDEGSANACDPSGNLLFYTNGVQVWDRNHSPMPNSSGLHGGISATQSALIVPAPGKDSLHLIFTVAAQLQGAHTGLSYSIVDMSHNAGLGDITLKNVLLCDSTTEKLTATRSTNGTDVWVLTHRWKSDAFYAYRVTCDSAGLPLVLGPVISHSGSTMGFDGALNPTATALGCMKISPDGRRLALVWSRYRNDTSADSDASVEWFDFDPATGTVSNPQRHDIPDLRAYGCAFSPSSRYLYITTYGLPNGIAYADIRQYDLDTADVPATEAIVHSGNPEFGTLQLGPDDKLYVARLSFNPFISVITQPDLPAANCGYLDMGASITPGSSTWGLPNFWDHPNHAPADIWAFTDTTICETDRLNISAIVPGAIDWLWSNGASGQTTTLEDTGLVAVAVILRCDTLRDTFRLRHRYCDPEILIAREMEICGGDGIVLDATSQGATAYAWIHGQQSPSIVTADTGWFWVRVTFPHEVLLDSIHISHRDCDCIILQNAFTPNADGINDEFRPRVDCELETYRLTVFDRWGRQLFNSTNPLQGWTGETSGGTAAPESVYYYILETKQLAQTVERKVGWVFLGR